jgi:methyl-accepting chemotaxis protein
MTMGNLLHSIRAKLITGLVVMFLAAVVIGAVGLTKISEFSEKLNFVATKASKRIVYVGNAHNAALRLYRQQKNHILANTPDTMKEREEKIAAADADFKKNMEEWDNVASEGGKKHHADAKSSYADFMRVTDRIIAADHAGKRAEAFELSDQEAKEAFQHLEDALTGASELGQKSIADEATDAEAAYGRTRWLMLALIVLGAGSSFCFAWMMTQQTTRRIAKVSDYLKDVAEGEGDLTKRIHVEHNDELGDLSNHFNTFMEKLHDIISQVAASTEHIASASEEISSSATQVAQSAETQKDQTSQVATAMQEMSSTVTQVSDNSRQASDNAKEAGDLARSGGTVVSQTVEVIKGVADATRDTSTKIEELGRSSDQIGQIIGVIDDIADQTNLLALNAAIEAARAGEQGRGFAVVADEVRKLAERTTQATKEIAQMIKTIQEETKKAVSAMKAGTDKVDAGVESAREAGAALEKIIHSADGVQDMVTHIATAATQQASATEQVNSNMEQIAKMVQQSSIGAQESARACQDLSNLALDLQQLVGRFKLSDRREQQRTTKSAHRKTTPPSTCTPHETYREPVGMVQ